MKSLSMSSLIVGTALATCLAAAPDATAATSRIKYIAASGVCQAVDPSNFTGLRFRTVGIYNASPSSIQVACSLPTEFVGDQSSGSVVISIHNFRSSSASMNCVVQGGNRRTGVNSYPATIDANANSNGTLGFNNIDKNSPGLFTHYSLACIIPPNMEMSTIRWEEKDSGDGL